MFEVRVVRIPEKFEQEIIEIIHLKRYFKTEIEAREYQSGINNKAFSPFMTYVRKM